MKTTSGLGARQRTLVLFLGAGDRIDPIRIMKGLFVFAKETPKGWLPAAARYDFVPYDYGPCSFQIYRDLEQLEAQGYVGTAEAPGQSWKYYSLTLKGKRALPVIKKDIDPQAADYLVSLRRFVDSLSFRRLLTTIYKRYPRYAENSVFK